MRRTQLAIAALAATGILYAAACSDTVESPPTVTPDQTGIVPPKPGPEKPGDGAGAVTLAVNKLYLGSVSRDGKSSTSNEWKKYGFNLDGKISTDKSKDLCQPREGANPANIYLDGDGGIDNSFGRNILPVIRAAAPDAESSVNDSILEGSFTLLLHIDKLGAGADYNPLEAKLYGGSDLGAAPKFDGTDEWPVIAELLDNPDDITSSKVKFASSYVVDNTWVSGSNAPINLSLNVSGFSLNLTISNAVLAMKLAPDHKSATEGTIAGVLETDVLTSELKKVVAAFDEAFCEDNSTVDSILTQIEQASDIMKDGSQDPTAICNGISIGLGFDMKEVKLGPVAPPGMFEDPCATGMGGAGGSGGMSCKTEADCPPPANECITATCLNGMCGEMNVAQGTPAATQVDGDCMMNQCTGTGMIETIKDNSDPAEDMKECTAGTCQADGSTTHAPVNLGTPCSENGGALCNNMGACVECLTTIDCTVVVGEICQNGNCVPPACANAAQDGAETDIDCGGPDCNKCGTNKNCMMSSDCISSVCTGNKCQAATCTDTTKNGSETDVDCGGATCPKCAGGMMCSVGSDCVSGSCQAGVCTMGGAGGAGGSG
ncbi:MAG: hypothetical protein HUU21_28425, partial [Polyangiaceae bacterium]|nr:hypothetical protein [Polyangiaceae bacterium]